MKGKSGFWIRLIKGILISIALLMLLFVSGIFYDGFSMVDLFMVLIPVFILIWGVILCWFDDFLGGVLFILLGIFYVFMGSISQGLTQYLFIAVLMFLIGILFLLGYYGTKIFDICKL